MGARRGARWGGGGRGPLCRIGTAGGTLPGAGGAATAVARSRRTRVRAMGLECRAGPSLNQSDGGAQHGLAGVTAGQGISVGWQEGWRWCPWNRTAPPHKQTHVSRPSAKGAENCQRQCCWLKAWPPRRLAASPARPSSAFLPVRKIIVPHLRVLAPPP